VLLDEQLTELHELSVNLWRGFKIALIGKSLG
jgi:hypothetical protein